MSDNFKGDTPVVDADIRHTLVTEPAPVSPAQRLEPGTTGGTQRPAPNLYRGY